MYKQIIALFLLSQSLSYGQTFIYHPFPEGNAYWGIYHAFNCPPASNNTYSYYFGSDTLIGTISYHKILSSSSGPIQACSGYIDGYQGALRQDTSSRRVFFIPRNDTIERVLYDFSLAAGDTTEVGGTFCFGPRIINSVDSVLIGSGYRKRWNLGGMDSYVEGIGSMGDLLKICEYSQSQINWSLYSFCQDGQRLIPDTLVPCNPPVNIGQVEMSESQVKLYPNPLIDQAIIYIPYFDGGTIELKIFDSLGRFMYSKSIFNSKTIVERRFLKSGMYYFKLEENSYRTVVGRFIVE